MKQLKIHIIKFVAITMSIAYLIAPLHNEINSVLHFISHNLEKPSVLISHNFDINSEVKLMPSAISSHEHRIIDFIDTIFGEDDAEQKDSKQPNPKESKIDKHLSSFNYGLEKLFSTKRVSTTCCYTDKIQSGFYKKIKIPPQFNLV
ncbi:hypothetical protein [Algibacter sp. 2305UL17-15]|uniref:hypothetical protein n=1 Tax=Algibacter sp. 2305UL17-15 TaxID=3231268 RepID=UPI003457ACB9